MEAEPSHSADGDRSGRQEQQQHVTAESSLGSCPPQQPQQPPNPRPVHRALGRLQNRQPKRTDLLLRLQHQQAVAWQHSDSQGPSGGSFFSMASQSTSPLPSTSCTQGEGPGVPSQSSQESQEVVSSPRKGEKKPQKPGKYVCTFCGRPCAKPSVLQKHIRSHTGERPYPCAPCGFSFKTKSNLYKHRKSHAHRIKAGLASSRDEPSLSGPEASVVGEDPEEHTEGESTESEEETGQHRKSFSKEMLVQQKKGGKERPGGSEHSQRPEDSQAVKQRLALRLSERKRGPMASPDDPPSSLSTSSSSSLGPGSKGSTESGYFSGSGSTDLSQVSPPSSSAKTYAEIILGKYGRLGGQQRSPHQQQPHSSHSSSSGTEDKSIPFAVPKTQVIEHITKLITINEAVVDTSEIDSVKPRRSSLSRKSSSELPKFATPKDPYTLDPTGGSAGPSSLRQLQSPEVDPQSTQELSTVPLLRSHSMPSSTSQEESLAPGTMSPRGFRLCQSFDEQQAVVAEMRVGHAQRMLRRQPAIEVPLGTEMLEDTSLTSSSATDTELGRQPLHQPMHKIPSLFECGACGAHFQNTEGLEAHRSICRGQEKESSDTSKATREDRPLMMHYKFRALAMAVRKRRKEESLEEDPPSPGSVATSGSFAGLIPVPSRQEHSQTLSGVSSQTEPNQQQQQQERKGVSVIQHTSSFEKQESISMESQETDLRESQQTQQPQPKPSPSTSRLIRQPNIQVPEILVTVEPDADMPSVSPPVTASLSKEAERVEEFQWPQRSQTLAQLPAEKLPPKKKRLRLAEVTQSSGESSFESMSLPRSPSQESNISSLSVSFEDPARSELAIRASSSQSSQMLMVPSTSHQHHQTHKEMRRSASEQTPASPQQTEQSSETRSKSFDYGSLSPQQPASSWKERRKCLLVKHPTLGEPEQDVGGSMSHLSRADSPKPGPSHSSHPPPPPCSPEGTPQYCLETTAKALQLLQPQILPHSQDVLPLQSRGHQAFPTGSLTQLLPVTTTIPEAMSTQVVHRAFLHSQGSPHIQIHPAQIHVAERFGLPLPQLSSLVPFQFSSSARASQAVYLPIPPRLTTHFPSPATAEGRPFSSLSSALTHQSLVAISYQHPRPVIATCLAQLTPVVSLMVPVRLQTHIPTYANAMYTTLSQILTSTRSQEPTACTAMVIVSQVEGDKLQRTYLKVPSPDIKSLLPLSLPTELASGSEEGYGPLGAGGSKRMLSPAASLELSTEAQRHQKRVKEEEEGEQCKAGEEKEEVEEVEAKVSPEEEGKATREKLEEREKKQTDVVQVTTVKVEDQTPRKNMKDEDEEHKKSSETSKKKKRR
uniref:HIVEP zinc finger 3b n=1 Tax=Salarias fasciatus TaxID=181472 RepID=A0A672GFF5_SALFA